jgi:formate/nitrite transporter FocA (FNT family)
VATANFQIRVYGQIPNRDSRPAATVHRKHAHGNTAFVALAIARTAAFEPAVRRTFDELGREALKTDFRTTVIRAIFAGWLIALTVWLLPAAESSRVAIIIIIGYIVGLGDFAHVIAGSVM